MLLSLILLGCIFHSSDTLVLVKFGRAYQHYVKNEKSSTVVHDPLDDYGLQRRIQLCDDVLNAKQYMTKYPLCYTRKRSIAPIVNLTRWNLPPDVPIGSLNFQRAVSSQHGGKDSAVLQYDTRYVKLNGHVQRVLKRIQCVHEATIDWFVMYGLVDNFMYVLEYDHKKKSTHRLVGILEENPLPDDRGLEYFQSQYAKYKDEMESICLLGVDDHLRLCSVVLSTLDTLGSLTEPISQFNYLERKTHLCVRKRIQTNGKMSREYFLRCNFVPEDGDKSLFLFYALADTNEEGAVFVFFEGEKEELRLHTRMVKIGALVNPVVDLRKLRLNADENRNRGDHQAGTSVSWRERVEKKNLAEQERRRRKNITPRQRSSSRQITPESESNNTENKTSQKKRKKEPEGKGKRLEKTQNVLVKNTEDTHSISHEDVEIVQINEENTSKNTKDLENSSDEGSIGSRLLITFHSPSTSRGGDLERTAEKSTHGEDGLRKVLDGSEKQHQSSSEEKIITSQGHVDSRERELLELEGARSVLAEHEKNSGKETKVHPPLSWGERAKRTQCIYD